MYPLCGSRLVRSRNNANGRDYGGGSYHGNTNTTFNSAFRRGRGNAAYPSMESLDSFFCDCLERVEASYRMLDRAKKVLSHETKCLVCSCDNIGRISGHYFVRNWYLDDTQYLNIERIGLRPLPK